MIVEAGKGSSFIALVSAKIIALLGNKKVILLVLKMYLPAGPAKKST